MMGLERTALPISWGRIGPECLNLTVPTGEDGELLPKSDILESQLATSLEGGDESANKRRNHAGMVPADRRLIKFRARG